MSHQRTIIRNALRDLLLGVAPTYNTTAQDRVFTNRTYNKKKLPAIIIYDDSENAVPRDIRSSVFIRTISCKIDITLEASSDYDQQLDDIAKQVEDLINASGNISGTSHSVVYTNTELNFEQGEKTLAHAVLTYEIKYLS